MEKQKCQKCGGDEFVTVNTPNSVNVNTIDSDKKVIIITDGTETVKEISGAGAAKITVCKKCGEVVIE